MPDGLEQARGGGGGAVHGGLGVPQPLGAEGGEQHEQQRTRHARARARGARRPTALITPMRLLLLAEHGADDALGVVRDDPQLGIPARLLHPARLPGLQRLRQVPLDVGVRALHEVPHLLGVALGVERAGQDVGRGGCVLEGDLHREVVVHGPPSRIEQEDAGGGVRGGNELSHHTGSLCTRRLLRGLRAAPLPSPAPSAPGWTATWTSSPLTNRVADERRRRRPRPPARRRASTTPSHSARTSAARHLGRPRGPPPRAHAAARRRRPRRRRWARAARGPWAA